MKKTINKKAIILIATIILACCGAIAFGIAQYQTAKNQALQEASQATEITVEDSIPSPETALETVTTQTQAKPTQKSEPASTEKDVDPPKPMSTAPKTNTEEQIIQQDANEAKPALDKKAFDVVQFDEPLTMYCISDMAKYYSGPDTEDFVDMGVLKLNREVTATGTVNEYKGQRVLWVEINAPTSAEIKVYVNAADLSETALGDVKVIKEGEVTSPREYKTPKQILQERLEKHGFSSEEEYLASGVNIPDIETARFSCFGEELAKAKAELDAEAASQSQMEVKGEFYNLGDTPTTGHVFEGNSNGLALH